MPQQLKVLVQYAQGLVHSLPGDDWFGNQDPYVSIKCGRATERTRTASQGGSNPVWNQVLYFTIDAERELHVTVKDECALVDLTLGAATASLATVLAQGADQQRITLTSKKGELGLLHLSMALNNTPLPGLAPDGSAPIICAGPPTFAPAPMAPPYAPMGAPYAPPPPGFAPGGPAPGLPAYGAPPAGAYPAGGYPAGGYPAGGYPTGSYPTGGYPGGYPGASASSVPEPVKPGPGAGGPPPSYQPPAYVPAEGQQGAPSSSTAGPSSSAAPYIPQPEKKPHGAAPYADLDNPNYGNASAPEAGPSGAQGPVPAPAYPAAWPAPGMAYPPGPPQPGQPWPQPGAPYPYPPQGWPPGQGQGGYPPQYPPGGPPGGWPPAKQP